MVDSEVGFDAIRVEDGGLVCPCARAEGGDEGLVKHAGD